MLWKNLKALSYNIKSAPLKMRMMRYSNLSPSWQFVSIVST